MPFPLTSWSLAHLSSGDVKIKEGTDKECSDLLLHLLQLVSFSRLAIGLNSTWMYPQDLHV